MQAWREAWNYMGQAIHMDHLCGGIMEGKEKTAHFLKKGVHSDNLYSVMSFR